MVSSGPDASQPESLTRRRFLQLLTGGGRQQPSPSEPEERRAWLTLVGLCHACGACAKACPKEALRLLKKDGRFLLAFQQDLCDGCGLCLKTCVSGCLTLSRRDEPLEQNAVILAEGALLVCRRCRGATAVVVDGYCPFCARAVGLTS